jgi:hypothetical protein
VSAGTRQQRIEAERRRSRILGAVAFAIALVTPALLFYDVVAVLAQDVKWGDIRYLGGWVPWVLLVAGLLFLAPVAWSAGMNPDSRWFPRARAAYAGWGITLYLLGFLLAWQVMRIQESAFS